MTTAAAQRLQAIVTGAVAALGRIDAVEAGRRPRPDAWSKQEILGHLLDSAVNNHARFVRAQLESDLRMPGYESAAWVRVQSYATRDWPALVELWAHYNLHLAHVVGGIPSAKLATPCRIGADAPTTLGAVVDGYLEHLLHHLRQIAPDIQG